MSEKQLPSEDAAPAMAEPEEAADRTSSLTTRISMPPRPPWRVLHMVATGVSEGGGAGEVGGGGAPFRRAASDCVRGLAAAASRLAAALTLLVCDSRNGWRSEERGGVREALTGRAAHAERHDDGRSK